MHRRKFIQYSSSGLLTGLSVNWGQQILAQSLPPTLKIQWFGHSCFLFTGDNQRILVNPFLNVGCNAGYQLPRPQTDLILISSQLLDEGSVDGFSDEIQILFDPGDYSLKSLKFRGISMDHDREGGRRFGRNVAWLWTQGGVKILHLGGAAAPITLEQKILMTKPDVLIIPVGGGEKNYNAEEAKKTILELSPKIVLPCQYLTEAADTNVCNLSKVDDFLNLVPPKQVGRLNGDILALSAKNLPQNDFLVRVLTVNSNK
jgi:L-ascorbate metabolism protein UlaG (beta-lactamase superfamily)